MLCVGRIAENKTSKNPDPFGISIQIEGGRQFKKC